MRHFALATDYDGTLAHHGVVAPETVRALERLAKSGRKKILVTGREMRDLLEIFPEIGLFDRVVAENGGVLYDPATRTSHLLAEAPSPELVARLRAKGVTPLSVGESIVATQEPHEAVVLEAIRELGLELQVVFNKGAVMVLPSGVNKASGVRHALAALGVSPLNTVAVGDAENDHALLAACACGVAVANALPALKERAAIVTRGVAGEGVAELIDALVADDLAGVRIAAHELPIATAAGGREITVDALGAGLLVVGPSRAGKTTVTTALIEAAIDAGLQTVVVDPEGDYAGLPGAVVLGDAERVPSVSEVVQVLAEPTASVVVALVAVPLDDRPAFVAELLPRLQEMRSRVGRPHWIVFDEAHHVAPASWVGAPLSTPAGLGAFMLVTLAPKEVARPFLARVDTVMAIGEAPEQTLAEAAEAIGAPPPPPPVSLAQEGEATSRDDGAEVLVWNRKGGAPLVAHRKKPRAELRRHERKYARGELGEDRSFYFRGEDGKLNLRAQNLIVFSQMAAGVDEATWAFHLANGDIARWFGDQVKDPELAREAERVATDAKMAPAETRRVLLETIAARYTH